LVQSDDFFQAGHRYIGAASAVTFHPNMRIRHQRLVPTGIGAGGKILIVWIIDDPQAGFVGLTIGIHGFKNNDLHSL